MSDFRIAACAVVCVQWLVAPYGMVAQTVLDML